MKVKQVCRILLLGLVSFYTLYMIANYQWFISEHLSNPPPTLSSLSSDLEKTQKDVKKLQDEIANMTSQVASQSADAAAAKAQLSAIH